MRILYIYGGDWPKNATRPRKQARVLVDAGHQVHMLSANRAGEPLKESESWMDVERVPRVGPRSLNRVLGFPVFANPFWAGWIIRAARKSRAECIIVRDLPLAPTALAVGKILGIPVHYEMADVYPVAMRANRADYPGLIAKFTRNDAFADWVDGHVIRRATSVFVVSEESRQRCLAFGASPDAVVIVGNTPAVLRSLDETLPIPSDIADWADRQIVLFIGNLQSDRGLNVAVDAIAEAAKEIPNAALVIIGDGWELEPVRAYVRAKGLEKHARLLGWKGPQDHAAYYQHAAIGILPFLSTEHINITLANKLFDYMGAALPIIGTDGPPMRRVLEETQAGVLVPAGQVKPLADAIVSLLRDPARRRELGARGRAAVSGPYSWARDSERLLKAVQRTVRAS